MLAMFLYLDLRSVFSCWLDKKNWPFEKGKLECNISIIVYINRRCYLLMNKKNISMRTLPSAHIFAGYSRECCCKSRSATSPVAARSLSLRQAQNFRTRKPIPTFWGRWKRVGRSNAWGFNMRVSWNGGTPKWMVYSGKTNLKWMRTGGTPILGYLHIHIIHQPTK